jgi:exodeoxyribonuclease V beta subunit
MNFIDMARHAVVEASAGTGKTYTIEHLVRSLVVEARAPLESILVVTYTEKATGELKTRLRGVLGRALDDHPDDANLRAALDHFDQAPIFTIHGFCQRLLQEYALDQEQDFRATLVEDFDVLRLGLRVVQRKLWHRQFGPHLRDVLQGAGYYRGKCAEWDRRALELAKNVNPRCGHRLLPAAVPDWWRRLADPAFDAAGQLEVFTVRALRRFLDDYKRQRGLQSFDDMIATVERALDPKTPGADGFAALLRQRYQFAVVDEFQDTDPLQWRIFKRVFLDAGESKLFVVGDPKQAIFGFRNADLPTFQRAVHEMKATYGAPVYPLQTNWRSAPELLDALNCLFGDGDWFPKKENHETEITYRNVEPPEPDKRQTTVTSDLTDRAALTVVDVQSFQKQAAAQRAFARFAAHEIHRLLTGRDGRPCLTFATKKGPARPLNAGDCCILIFKRTEAEPIVEALRRYNLPYSFYRQTGVWTSPEAVQLETLLRTLARPDDRAAFRKALLTRFFRLRPEDVARAPDLPARHPARLLYEKWLACVEGRHWSALFQSLLEETGLALADPDDADADRRLAALRHLCGTLERVGHGENRDLLGLLEWIADRRAARDGDAEPAPAETSRPRVKIMTVFASKGLEFPVVFLAGGFTQGMAGAVTTYRDGDQNKTFDLCPTDEAKGWMKEDALDEHRRLLYVALTRPMLKLYVPLVKLTSYTKSRCGPVGSVLMPAVHRACPDKLGPAVAEHIPLPPAMAPPREAGRADGEAAPGVAPFAIAGPLFPACDPALPRRRVVVRSFSSMSRAHVLPVGHGASYGERARRLDEEVVGPAERDDPLRGPVFGDMVHRVLEDVDFAEVGRAETPDALLRDGAPARALIERIVRGDVGKLRTRTPLRSLEQACREQVARLVWSALHAPLDGVGPLWRIPAADRLHEVEFSYPAEPGAAVPADVRWEDGFLTGCIDLVFRKGGRYFLVDWKTNLLPAYAADHVGRCMDECDYHRQYRLYVHALDRWLRRAPGGRFDLAADFGGVYYLFVRGLGANGDGVFFCKPTKKDLDLKPLVSS